MIENKLPPQEFVSMEDDKRIEYVDSAKKDLHEKPLPLGNCKYPEEEFLDFVGSQNGNSIKLHTYREQSKKHPVIGVIIIFHGLHFHVGHSAHLAHRFAFEGFDTVGFDMRGHGKSEGQRGLLDSTDSVIEDGINFIRKVKQQYKDVPLFIWGEGFGSILMLNIVINHAKEFDFPIAGIIASSGYYKLPKTGLFYRLMSNILLTLTTMVSNTVEMVDVREGYELSSKNPRCVDYLLKDPLTFHGNGFSGTMKVTKELMDRLPEQKWPEIQTPPIVVLHGRFDKVGNAIHAVNFFRKIKSKDKTILFYDNMWHYGLLEQENADYGQEIVKWLHGRAPYQ